MRFITSYMFLLAGTCLVSGCGERVSVGRSGYIYFTADTLPDGHPGTVLRYKGKQVWPSIHPGYFHDSPTNFYRDRMIVFVGSVPSRTEIMNYDAQLFATREAEQPVLISQRAFQLSLTNSYYIDHITPVSDGFRVVIRFWETSRNNVTITNTILWSNIASWLKEAEAVPLTQFTPSTAFRLLP
jgi:hypothetical protein